MTRRKWEFLIVLVIVSLVVVLRNQDQESAAPRPQPVSPVLDQSYVVGNWSCTFPPSLPFTVKFSDEGKVHLSERGAGYSATYSLRRRSETLWELDMESDVKRVETLIRFIPPDKLGFRMNKAGDPRPTDTTTDTLILTRY